MKRKTEQKVVTERSDNRLSVEPTRQTYTDETLGAIPFIDVRETIHSAKCRVSDIRLGSKYDRPTTVRLKRDIAEDINSAMGRGS